MTRRDLQLVARDKGRPWDTGKDIEQGSVCSEIAPMPGAVIENGAIALEVNGTIKQPSNVDKLIRSIREIIADLSTCYHLLPPATRRPGLHRHAGGHWPRRHR